MTAEADVEAERRSARAARLRLILLALAVAGMAAIGIVPGTIAYTVLGARFTDPTDPLFLGAMVGLALLAVGGSALLSDCHPSALVALDGSIEWLAFPAPEAAGIPTVAVSVEAFRHVAERLRVPRVLVTPT